MTTSSFDAELIGATGDIQAVIDTATAATAPKPLGDDGRFYSVIVPAGGAHEVVDLEEHLEALLDRPRRKRGTYQVHDADSFVTYIKKHGDAGTEIWADTTASKVTAVLNAHDGIGEEAQRTGDYDARWEDHRVAYTAMLTDAWKAWTARDGKLLGQVDFAEHIEDRSPDIIEPAAADMLELAQTFHATIGVSFESSKRLSSGEAQLEYRETVEARAGKSGRLDIPQTFTLVLRPFEGANPFKVTARLRYRINDGVLRLGFKLDRPDDVLREAFLDVVGQIQGQVDQPVIRGSR